jgi:hypothetical protein
LQTMSRSTPPNTALMTPRITAMTAVDAGRKARISAGEGNEALAFGLRPE